MPKGGCKVCAHKKRAEINKLLADPGSSNAAVARKFGLVARTVDRHKKGCLQGLAKRVDAAKKDKSIVLTAGELELGGEILSNVEQLQRTTLSLINDAIRQNEAVLALKGIAQARPNYELLAKLTGKLHGDSGEQRLATFEELALIYRKVTDA